MTRRRWMCALGVALALVAGAATAAAPGRSADPQPVPLKSARATATRALLHYLYGLDYVTDYGISTCTRASRSVLCAYHFGFYNGRSCHGTLQVRMERQRLGARFVGDPCAGATVPLPTTTTTGTVPTSTDPSTVGTTTIGLPPSTTQTTPTGTTPATGYELVADTLLDFVSDDRSHVTLDDGSNWLIASSGRAVVAGWSLDDAIDVETGPGTLYTLSDTDAEDDGGVTATFLGYS